MKVEGILIHTTDIGNFHSYLLLDIVKRKIPIVLIGNPTKVAHIPNVFLDLEEGSYNLTRYLIYRGYKKFLYLSGSKKAETFLQRINGHKKALSEAGILVKEEDIVETIPEIDGGYDTTFKLFSKKNFPYDAVICVNDYMALGALKALKELGISIPNQVGVAGYDDVIYSTLSDFPITTVKIPIQEIAQLSTNLLLNQIENKGGEREKLDYVVKTEVVIRDSTR
jgi:LacI family transcriptional regulator